MHTFFHGWRRKAGVITLMVACGLMGMWIRSLVCCDSLRFDLGVGRTARLTSANQSLGLVMQFSEDLNWIEGTVATTDCLPAWESTSITERGAFEDEGIDWDYRWHGFGRGRKLSFSGLVFWSDIQYQYWVLPCWSVAPPLTLLSAYLMLWKPRKRD